MSSHTNDAWSVGIGAIFLGIGGGFVLIKFILLVFSIPYWPTYIKRILQYAKKLEEARAAGCTRLDEAVLREELQEEFRYIAKQVEGFACFCITILVACGALYLYITDK